MTAVLLVAGIICALYGAAMAALYPAGGFFVVWLLLAAGFLAVAWARHTGAWERLHVGVRRAVCGVAGTLGILVVACCVIIFGTASKPAPDDADYVVVLGASLNADGSPKEALRYRLDRAFEYLTQVNVRATCIVSGGQGFDEVQSEASSMAAYLIDRGLDPERLVLEDRSTSTAENLRFSRQLMVGEDGGAAGADAASGGAAEGEPRVVVVTNNFHLFRALRIAWRQGLEEAAGLSAPMNPFYLPHATLRECFALTKDALVGNL